MKAAAPTPHTQNLPKRTKAKPKKPTQTKGWSTARRIAQANRLRRTKIWLKSTGPKTVNGKIRSSQNAQKHFHDHARTKRIRTFLRDQKSWLKTYLECRRLYRQVKSGKVNESAVPEVLKYLKKTAFLLGESHRKMLVSAIQILRENNG